MTNTLVPHEIAVELKRLGFDWLVNHMYGNLQEGAVVTCWHNHNCMDTLVSAPDIYQAAAWLREVKGVHVFAFPSALFFGWDYRVMDVTTKKLLNILAETFPDHDTAYIAGIENGLKLVK
jgi:hypothetical protein